MGRCSSAKAFHAAGQIEQAHGEARALASVEKCPNADAPTCVAPATAPRRFKFLRNRAMTAAKQARVKVTAWRSNPTWRWIVAAHHLVKARLSGAARATRARLLAADCPRAGRVYSCLANGSGTPQESPVVGTHAMMSRRLSTTNCVLTRAKSRLTQPSPLPASLW